MDDSRENGTCVARWRRDISARDENNGTALHSYFGRPGIARVFPEHDAKVNSVNDSAQTHICT